MAPKSREAKTQVRQCSGWTLLLGSTNECNGGGPGDMPSETMMSVLVREDCASSTLRIPCGLLRLEWLAATLIVRMVEVAEDADMSPLWSLTGPSQAWLLGTGCLLDSWRCLRSRTLYVLPLLCAIPILVWVGVSWC